MALVLNLQTGLVSPQFHTKWDDLFEIVNDPMDDSVIRWRYGTPFKRGGPRNRVSEGDAAIPLLVEQLSVGELHAAPPIPPEPPPDIPAEAVLQQEAIQAPEGVRNKMPPG